MELAIETKSIITLIGSSAGDSQSPEHACGVTLPEKIK